jgi:hypothetical protein
MYGDTAVIRRLAHDLREQADQLRGEAAALRGQAEAVLWHGWAGDGMRALVRERAESLRDVATAHDAAADVLEQHARDVDRRKEQIAALEGRARALVASARGRLADLGRRILDGAEGLVADPGDLLLDRFVPPPTGHLDWLDVELPGLHR